MTYLATFYSHFGAIRYQKLCRSRQVEAVLMPVPRDLSSSCGTCLRYVSPRPDLAPVWPQEVEQVVELTPQGYRTVYRAENG